MSVPAIIVGVPVPSALPTLQQPAAPQSAAAIEGDPPLDDRLRAQVEYYFSPENIVHDRYLAQLMSPSNVVPLAAIAAFNKVRRLTEDFAVVHQAVAESDRLILRIDVNGMPWVGPNPQANPRSRCTIILRDVSPSADREQLQSLLTKPIYHIHRFDMMGVWHVVFSDNKACKDALFQLQGKTLAGYPVNATVKTDNADRNFCDVPNPLGGGGSGGTVLTAAALAALQQQQVYRHNQNGGLGGSSNGARGIPKGAHNGGQNGQPLHHNKQPVPYHHMQQQQGAAVAPFVNGGPGYNAAAGFPLIQHSCGHARPPEVEAERSPKTLAAIAAAAATAAAIADPATAAGAPTTLATIASISGGPPVPVTVLDTDGAALFASTWIPTPVPAGAGMPHPYQRHNPTNYNNHQPQYAGALAGYQPRATGGCQQHHQKQHVFSLGGLPYPLPMPMMPPMMAAGESILAPALFAQQQLQQQQQQQQQQQRRGGTKFTKSSNAAYSASPAAAPSSSSCCGNSKGAPMAVAEDGPTTTPPPGATAPVAVGSVAPTAAGEPATVAAATGIGKPIPPAAVAVTAARKADREDAADGRARGNAADGPSNGGSGDGPPCGHQPTTAAPAAADPPPRESSSPSPEGVRMGGHNAYRRPPHGHTTTATDSAAGSSKAAHLPQHQRHVDAATTGLPLLPLLPLLESLPTLPGVSSAAEAKPATAANGANGGGGGQQQPLSFLAVLKASKSPPAAPSSGPVRDKNVTKGSRTTAAEAISSEDEDDPPQGRPLHHRATNDGRCGAAAARSIVKNGNGRLQDAVVLTPSEGPQHQQGASNPNHGEQQQKSPEAPLQPSLPADKKTPSTPAAAVASTAVQAPIAVGAVNAKHPTPLSGGTAGPNVCDTPERIKKPSTCDSGTNNGTSKKAQRRAPAEGALAPSSAAAAHAAASATKSSAPLDPSTLPPNSYAARLLRGKATYTA